MVVIPVKMITSVFQAQPSLSGLCLFHISQSIKKDIREEITGAHRIKYFDVKLDAESTLYGYSAETEDYPETLKGVREVARFIARYEQIGDVYIYDSRQQLVLYVSDGETTAVRDYSEILRPLLASEREQEKSIA